MRCWMGWHKWIRYGREMYCHEMAGTRYLRWWQSEFRVCERCRRNEALVGEDDQMGGLYSPKYEARP